MAVARTRGLHRIEVMANLHAKGFYEKLGFVHDGEVMLEFGPGMRMHRDVVGDP